MYLKQDFLTLFSVLNDCRLFSDIVILNPSPEIMCNLLSLWTEQMSQHVVYFINYQQEHFPYHLHIVIIHKELEQIIIEYFLLYASLSENKCCHHCV